MEKRSKSTKNTHKKGSTSNKVLHLNSGWHLNAGQLLLKVLFFLNCARKIYILSVIEEKKQIVSLNFLNKFFFFFLEFTPIANEQALLNEYAKYEYETGSENPE